MTREAHYMSKINNRIYAKAYGHDQEEGCCCSNHSHGHEHHHEHGHHHEHEHPHCHEHGHQPPEDTKHPDAFMADGVKLICLLENLGCANCAAKRDSRINDLPEVNAATLTFTTKQLRVSITPEAAKKEDALIAKFQEICTSIEQDVTVTKQHSYQKGKKALGKQEHEGKKRKFREHQADLAAIISGALLFVAGELLEQAALTDPWVSAAIFVAAYVILGGQIVATALKNLARGQIFDENFLMSLATLGAFAIGDFAEAVGVMLFYRIGEYFEEAAVSRSRSQIMDAVDLRPETVNLIANGSVKTIPAQQASIGDMLLVRPGDRIPLDGTIVEGESRLDTSPITGEPVPVKAVAGNAVTSGCINISGQLKIRAEKNLENSMVTRILDSVENAAASKPKIDRFITRFSRVYTPIVVVTALATAIIPSLISGDWNHWVYTALTFLVISCPCALVLSVPLAFFSGIGAGSKKGILFKGGVSMEALKHISAVVMDKTGTITAGRLKCMEINVYVQDMSVGTFVRIAAALEKKSEHPLAEAVLEHAGSMKLSVPEVRDFRAVFGRGVEGVLAEDIAPGLMVPEDAGPVSATRPSAGGTCTGNGPRDAGAKAGTRYFVGNQAYMEEQGIRIEPMVQQGIAALADEGMTPLLMAEEGRFLGIIGVADEIKPTSREAIRSFRKTGIHVRTLY